MITVSELIEMLQKCNPDATVEFAYERDETTSGNPIFRVAQFIFFGNEKDETYSIVQLRGD